MYRKNIIERNTCQLRSSNLHGTVADCCWLVLVCFHTRVEDTDVMVCSNEGH